ncbi:MAG: flagellar biosynthetic protein FliR [Planctomycetota bacterium]
MEFLEENVRFIMLHWVRCLALVGPLPIFGQGGTSRMARVGLGVALGTILSLLADIDQFDDPGQSLFLAVMVLKESLFGFILAFIVLISFATLRICGHIIGEEMGFNMASIQDPITGVNSQLIAHLFESIGMMIFFMTNGHHVIIRALARSFEVYPVGKFDMSREFFSALVLFSSGMFASALQVCAPVFVALFAIAIALAIVARVAPQLQVMQFAFPAKILTGLILLVTTIHVLAPSMIDVFEDLEIFLFEMFE